ncbi:hypothetical protein [Methylobacter svalbardensis]
MKQAKLIVMYPTPTAPTTNNIEFFVSAGHRAGSQVNRNKPVSA